MTVLSSSAPLFVVVTPVYNGARFLTEAMDAVQAQTYPNVLHIVLDNASTDATPEILKGYSNSRVPVVVKRNASLLSLEDNWNAAIELVPAEAAYFRVLCADDVMAPDFAEKTIAVAERNPGVVAVGCKLNHRGLDPDADGWERTREVFGGKETVRRFFDGSGVIIAHQVTYQRRLVDLRKPFFETQMTTNDTDACLDILRHGDWGYVHEILATTRDHAGTDTNTLVKPTRLDLCEHLVLMERHAEFGLGEKAGRQMARLYRRFYLRKLLGWRLKGDARAKRHMASLKHLGVRNLLAKFLDAVMDWPLARLKLRPYWSGYPS